MTSFAISPLADPVGCYSLWPSTARRVARNSVGTFYSVQTRIGNIAAGAPNDFTIYREVGGVLSVLYTVTNLVTNMVTIDSFSTGELYAAWSDFINGINYVAYWADSSSNASPIITTLTGSGCAGNGKIAFIANETDRCLYFFGDAGWIFRLSETAVEYGRQHVFQCTSDQTNYMTMSFDDGKLYLGMCEAIAVGSSVSYDDITFVMTPNSEDIGGIGASFFSGPWPASAPMTLPFDPGFSGSAAYATIGTQYRNNSNYLISSTVQGGIIHLAYSQVPGQGTRFFDFDDLRDLTVEMCSLNFNSQPMALDGAIHRPLRDGPVLPRACSGGVAIRKSGVFAILHDRTSLIAMRSQDQGKTWSTWAQTTVPSLGTDTIHYMSLLPGNIADPDLVGAFSVVHCTPTQWANSTAPVPPAYAANNPTATALRFSVPSS